MTKPWEMTRSQWLENVLNPIEKACEESRGLETEKITAAKKGIDKKFGWDNNYTDNLRHEVQVFRALEKGIKVAQVVLIDYPPSFWLNSFDLKSVATNPQITGSVDE